MNESNQAEGLPQTQQQPLQQQAQPIQPPSVPPGTSEPLVPQHRVNELISDALRRGHEKAMREREQSQSQQSPSSMHPDEIRRVAREEFANAQAALQQQLQQQHEQDQAKAVQGRVESKLQEAKKSDRYPDFDETIRELELHKMLPLVWHADTVDNTADVLYDLGKNKGKLAMLNALPPHLIPGEIQKLSNSIKMNQGADAGKLPKDPFDNLKPTAGVGIDKRPSERNASEWNKHYKGKF